jgi:hypothetical protein
VKVALVYCPAMENSNSIGGHELVMPPIGICSVSSFLRANGYSCDLFDLMLKLDTTVLHMDFKLPLERLFAASRSQKGFNPEVISDLSFYLALNRNYLAREIGKLYRELDDTDPHKERASDSPVRRFFAQHAEMLAQYGIVGLSVIFEEQLMPALILARWIRAYSSKIRIVVGGPGARPEIWRADADMLLRGDGESAFLAYVRSQDASAPAAADCPLDGGNAVAYCDSLDDLPAADFHVLFSDHHYLAPVRIIPLAVTRGCYWSRCLFCSFGWRSEDSGMCTAPYRKMSPAKAVSDILLQKRDNDTQHFFFSVDAVDPGLLEEISDELLERSAGIYWAANVRAERRLLRADLIPKLYRAGCRTISCGYESFNQRVLDSMQKGIWVKDSIRILDGLCETGIRPNIGYFMGWPGETPAEAAETHAVAYSYFKKVPGNAAERFVPVEDSPVVRRGYQGTWQPLRYLQDRNSWIKQGMSWEAQERQWMIFAANLYCDSENSCLSVRGDGGYAFMLGAHYDLSELTARFRNDSRSFGVLGMGRMLFYGFFHTRHYCFEMARPFCYETFLRHCPQCPEAARLETTGKERLDFAYRTVLAFIEAQSFSDSERDFIRQVARFDYGLLVSCLNGEALRLIRVDREGNLMQVHAGSEGIYYEFTIDVERVSIFVPFEEISRDCRCRATFGLNGVRILKD